MTKGETQNSHQEFVLRQVLESLQNVRFGSIRLVVQDGRVIQIEKVERLRFPQKVPCC